MYNIPRPCVLFYDPLLRRVTDENRVEYTLQEAEELWKGGYLSSWNQAFKDLADHHFDAEKADVYFQQERLLDIYCAPPA